MRRRLSALPVGARSVAPAQHREPLIGEGLALVERRDLVFVAVDHERRALEARTERAARFTVRLVAEVSRRERLAIGVEAPADAVLDVLRGVRLEEAL